MGFDAQSRRIIERIAHGDHGDTQGIVPFSFVITIVTLRKSCRTHLLSRPSASTHNPAPARRLIILTRVGVDVGTSAIEAFILVREVNTRP